MKTINTNRNTIFKLWSTVTESIRKIFSGSLFSDHTNDIKLKKEICDELALYLLAVLSDFNNARNHSRKHFTEVKQEIQSTLNDKMDESGSKGMHIDIMQIQLCDMVGKRSLLEWAKNFSKIRVEKVREFEEKFQEEFSSRYFDNIFADVSDNRRAARNILKKIRLK